MGFLSKILFSWKKPKIIIVTGNGRQTAREAIFQVLKQHFKVGLHPSTTPPLSQVPEILIFETDLKEQKELEFLIKKSSLPILLITHFGDIPPDKDFFAGERKDVIRAKKIAKIFPPYGYLILNFDDETTREIKDYNPPTTPSHILTFGFQEGADFGATDINLNSGTNFKINYKGNIVPIWLDKVFNKEEIYPVLASIAVGTILGLNLVEISNILKNYPFLSEEIKAST